MCGVLERPFQLVRRVLERPFQLLHRVLEPPLPSVVLVGKKETFVSKIPTEKPPARGRGRIQAKKENNHKPVVLNYFFLSVLSNK